MTIVPPDPNYVPCPYCREEGLSSRLRWISPKHLAVVHNKTMEDISRDYPDATLSSQATQELRLATWKRPGVRKRRVKGMRSAWRLQAVQQKHSESMKLAHNDPHKRARIIAGLRKAFADPEISNKRIRAVREALAKPEVRKKFSAARKADWKKPDVRAKYVKHTKQIWINRKQKLAELEAKLAQFQAASAGNGTGNGMKPKGKVGREAKKKNLFLRAGEFYGQMDKKSWATVARKFTPDEFACNPKAAAEKLRLGYNYHMHGKGQISSKKITT